jgi:hypothetical protein
MLEARCGVVPSRDINPDRDADVAYWTATLRVSRQQLCDAIRRVGANSHVVGRHLRSRRHVPMC